MGKKEGGGSWLAAVKRAFVSPNKDKREDEEKKGEKRRWAFKKLGKNKTQMSRIIIGEEKESKEAEEAADDVGNGKESVSLTWHYAAVRIQTAFRAYLARRALRALKGLVKLQALVRGHNVRRQAKMTLKCMQALVHVQTTVLDQRMRIFINDSGRKSTHSDNDEEFKMMVQRRKCEILAAERRRRRSSAGHEEDEWLDRWIATQITTDGKPTPSIDTTKIADVDVPWRSNVSHSHSHLQHRRVSSAKSADSSFYKASQSWSPRQQHQALNSPSKTKSPKVNASFLKDDMSSTSSLTPSLRSHSSSRTPNYMAATESTKARLRPNSAAKQRISTPERQRNAGKNRTPFQESDPNSPSLSQFSVFEQQSNLSICYTENMFDEGSLQ